MQESEKVQYIVPVDSSEGENATLYFFKNNQILQSVTSGCLSHGFAFSRELAIKMASAILEIYNPSREEIESLKQRVTIQ